MRHDRSIVDVGHSCAEPRERVVAPLPPVDLLALEIPAHGVAVRLVGRRVGLACDLAQARIVLDRHIADRRIFPAIDLNRSGTRREDLLLTEMELTRVYLLRNFLSDMPPAEAIDFLLTRMKKTKTNKDFLDSMAKGG